MSERITASDLNMALDAMKAKREKWLKEHPDEKEEVCPKCRNTGLVLRVYDEWGKEVFGEDMKKAGTYDYYEPCTCIKGKGNLVMKNNKNYANVPNLYKDAMFDNFLIEIYGKLESRQLAGMAKRKCMAYVEKFHKAEEAGMGLYIYSDAKGSGKTRLVSTISNELTARGKRNKFVSASEILGEIQDTWHDQSKSETKVMNTYIEPNVLIVDDFGAKGSKDWIDKRFQYLMEKRYGDNKITIFTSNYSVDRLPFDDNRIADRISDVERFYIIKMPNETLRPRPRNGSGNDPFRDLFGV